MKTKTWDCGYVTRATPSERGLWIVYRVPFDPTYHVARASCYWGVNHYGNMYRTGGGVVLLDEAVHGEYRTREEAVARAAELPEWDRVAAATQLEAMGLAE